MIPNPQEQSHRAKNSAAADQCSKYPFDLSAVLASSQMAAKPTFGEGFLLSADHVPGVVSGVDAADILGVNALFWERRFEVNRRIWEVFLNRLRRFGQSLKVQEEGIVVIDLATAPDFVFDLRKQFSSKPNEKRKKNGTPWHLLLQYPYRSDSTGILEELQQIPGFRLSFSKATGCWGFIAPPTGETWTSVFGRLVAVLSCWFDLVLVANNEGLVRFTSSQASSLPNPLEAQPFEVPIKVDRDKVIQAIRSVGADVTREAKLRIFKYSLNAAGGSDGGFVPFETDFAQYTRSGTIFVGWSMWLFALDLRTSKASYAGSFDQKSVKRLTARHYRNQRAINEPNGPSGS